MSRAPVLVAMVALWLCWGSSMPAMHVLVEGLPPLTTTGVVFLTAGVVLALARPRFFRDVARRPVAGAAAIGVCLLGAQGSVAVAVVHVPASTAALLAGSVPLFLAVLRALTGDRPGRAELVRLAVGFVGVAVVALADAGSPGWSPWALVVVGASVAWAAGTLLASRVRALPEPVTTTTVQLLSGGAVVLAAGLLLEPGAALVGTVASWSAFGWLVLVDSLAGFALFGWLLRRAPVAWVGSYAYAVPVVAYAVGVLVLGEPFQPVAVVGAVLILGAVVTSGRAAPVVAVP